MFANDAFMGSPAAGTGHRFIRAAQELRRRWSAIVVHLLQVCAAISLRPDALTYAFVSLVEGALNMENASAVDLDITAFAYERALGW